MTVEEWLGEDNQLDPVQQGIGQGGQEGNLL